MLFPPRKNFVLLKKKKKLIPVLCCTNSSTFVYLIASLNNFCTLLKWQKLFENLFYQHDPLLPIMYYQPVPLFDILNVMCVETICTEN